MIIVIVKWITEKSTFLGQISMRGQQQIIILFLRRTVGGLSWEPRPIPLFDSVTNPYCFFFSGSPMIIKSIFDWIKSNY
jgi:hypothetical protein